MRVSIEQGDSGEIPMSRARGLTVFCDGKELNHVRTADEELGVAVVIATDRAGHILHNGGKVLTETVRGRIEIREMAAE